MKEKANPKYAEIRRQTAEQKDSEEIDLDIEKAQNQIATDLQHYKGIVLDRKKALQAAIRAQQFNTANILNAKRQLAIAHKDVEEIQALKEELF